MLVVKPECTLFHSTLSDPLSSNGASDSASGVGSNNLTVGEEGVGSGATNTSPSRSQGAAAPQAAASAQQVCSLGPHFISVDISVLSKGQPMVPEIF